MTSESKRPRKSPKPPSRTQPAVLSGSPERPKRALSALQPPHRHSGESHLAGILTSALEAAAQEEPDRLTHGFHSYPGRLHPAIAATVLDALATSGATVVDPFCGSGTTLVEARVRGLPSLGVDLNPVALRVAEVKTDVRSRASIAMFRERLLAVAEGSRARVKAKVPARAPLSVEQVKRFDGHVLRELAGLHEEIRAVSHDDDRRALQVVLSSLVVKVSRQRADTDAREVKGRTIGRYISTDMFESKGLELAERWEALAGAAPPGPAPVLVLDDARALPRVVGDRKARIILSSPPYAGTYDYATHHALREPWLGVRATRLMDHEIGARRRSREGLARWERELLDVLHAIRGSLEWDGIAVLVVGDGELGGERLPADAQLSRLAPEAELSVLATASAPRVDWRGGPDREEHLVALRCSAPVSRRADRSTRGNRSE